MLKIKIENIKKLRNITGVSLIECKKSLIISNGNIENAIIEMRKSGILNIFKKNNIILNNGIIDIKKKKNYIIVLEINCQTDYASKSIEFKNFFYNILNNILNNKIKTIEELKKFFKNEIIDIYNKIKENIIIKHFNIFKGNIIESYVHNNRICVIIKAKYIKKNILKKIAMHIAASKPEFINLENIKYNLIVNEFKIYSNILNKKKKKIFFKKILFGKINKYIKTLTLFNQQFIFDTNKNIKEILHKKNSIIYNFILYELGKN
ncbi:translation elongation factor Ts [Enterobacterales bacterium endosymbiont of Anomoneura mori]|uniref:translation elongation factor Ts n=1 Tax=Enterobacterales bacterium endosymbiont of Anomoneura mori TaxID=3132096 RepID=UPI00399C62AD